MSQRLTRCTLRGRPRVYLRLRLSGADRGARGSPAGEFRLDGRSFAIVRETGGVHLSTSEFNFLWPERMNYNGLIFEGRNEAPSSVVRIFMNLRMKRDYCD